MLTFLKGRHLSPDEVSAGLTEQSRADTARHNDKLLPDDCIGSLSGDLSNSVIS